MPRNVPLGGRRRGSRSAIAVDTSVPALMMRIGTYPLHHGSVGAVRSLGRLGIPVFAVTEDRFTPTAQSRYLRRAIVWRTTGAEDPQELVSRLLEIGAEIGARPVLVATDDEAALLIAEHAPALSELFRLPRVAADLPRRLASKQGLATLCRELDVAAPASGAPRSMDELFEEAHRIGFPLIVKNDEAWLRLTNPAVPSSTLVHDLAGLEALAAGWPSLPSVLLQEHIPPDGAQDWIVHAYFGEDPETVVAFTGIKLRSWPPKAGVTALAYSTPNPDLLQLAVGFGRRAGFRGIADMDWRLDARDGRYKLLDFNPRMGAQFRMFDTVDGVDVVRALHLDLTGRPVPRGHQIDGRRYVVGHLSGPSALASLRDGRAATQPWSRAGAGAERAWFAIDDPVPAAIAAARLAAGAPRTLAALLSQLCLLYTSDAADE